MISKGRLFTLIFLPAAGILICGLALIQQKNIELSAEQFEKLMKNQWFFASMLLKDGAGNDEFKSLFEKTGLRVTVVDQAGRVIFDSAGREITESHRDREEIRNALLDMPSLNRRYSRTTQTHTIYYARKLPDGRILRLAYQGQYYDEQLSALLTQTLLALALLMATVAVFALWVSKRFGRALAELGQAVQSARNGGVELPSFNNESLDRALYSLSAATRELKLSNEKNAEINARLEYVLNNISEGAILFNGDRIVYHNQRAAEILNHKIPAAVSLVNRPKLINVLESLANGQSRELRLDNKVIAVDRALSGSGLLAILHDISDKDKYSGYKSELIGNISHELKTPLTLIMTAAEVIVKDREVPPPLLEKFLGTIHKNARRLDFLLDDLIFLHKLESGGAAEPGDLDLEDVLTEIQDLIDCRGKRVIYEVDRGRARIHSPHLVSLLTNLIGNAVKYSTGGVIRVAVRKKDKTLDITVADEGPAIPVEERERIFERFYSLSESRNRQQSGSGLGLAIVKHITRQYNGRVRVSDNHYSGNTFSVTLMEK